MTLKATGFTATCDGSQETGKPCPNMVYAIPFRDVSKAVEVLQNNFHWEVILPKVMDDPIICYCTVCKLARAEKAISDVRRYIPEEHNAH